MDAQEFADLRATLPHLLELQTLDGTNPDIRSDGVPQNWLDDLPRLSADQRETLAADIPGESPAWAQALKQHLLAA